MENQNTKPYTNKMFTYFKSWQIGMKVKIENESWFFPCSKSLIVLITA